MRWYSSIKDLKDRLHIITQEPPSTQHIFHFSNPTEFRNSSTLQSIGIDHDGFTLQVAFDDYARAPFYLEPLKKELIDDAGAMMLEEVRQGFMRDKTPKATDELDGSGGSYFLRSQKGFYSAVFKPHDEEQGMPNNRKGYSGAGETGLRDHFRPGQGCLREVAAYILDHENFCQVPPTVLVHCQHPSFSYPTLAGRTKLFPKLGSLQQFMKASECFDDLGPGIFSDFEIQKIALLDLRLLNCDRNAANMLVRYKKIFSTSLTSSEGNTPSDDNPSVEQDARDWIDEGITISDSSDFYEIVPIDHGYCMPSKLRIDEYDLVWMSLPQVKREVHPAIKEYVASLDFESMLYNVLEQISLPGNSIFLLALAHLLVVQGVSSGLTLYEIATLVARLDDEHASKLEQAIEEAEENAFRAIEMKTNRIPSNPNILSSSNNHHPNMKSVSSPLQQGVVSRTTGGNSSKEMELASPSISSSKLPKSLSMSELKQIHDVDYHFVDIDKSKPLSIGTDGVWDLKSLAACASPSTSVIKSASPRYIQKRSPISLGHLDMCKSTSILTTHETDALIFTDATVLEKPSPLELGSDFLSDLILAAISDDCEVAVNSPTKMSPLKSSLDVIHGVPKLEKSPVSIKEYSQSYVAGYLAPIEEERRMRGGSTGSTCSSTDNNGVESTVSDPTPTREALLTLNSDNITKSHINDYCLRNVNSGILPPDRLGPALTRMPRYIEAGSDVVYRSVNLQSPPSLNASLLTSPKFISALSNMHSQGGGSFEKFSPLTTEGPQLSRMRSVGPLTTTPMHVVHLPEPQQNVSISNSSNKSDSTFEGLGTGLEIDSSYDVNILVEESISMADEVALDVKRIHNCAPSKIDIENNNSVPAVVKSAVPDMYSPLARILAVPSDPNLSSSLLATCMSAGDNNFEPIDQPSLRKIPPMPPKIDNSSDFIPSSAFVAAPDIEFNAENSQRKRKHELFMSGDGESIQEGGDSRPYSTPSPASRTVRKDAHIGSRSATQDAPKAWNKANELHETKTSANELNDPELTNAPSMARVASFSGFESAPVYNLQAEGRFGNLRQEKRKTIMKTPEFNKFRLHFAHEAVLSIINRLLKQKDAQKSK